MSNKIYDSYDIKPIKIGRKEGYLLQGILSHKDITIETLICGLLDWYLDKGHNLEHYNEAMMKNMPDSVKCLHGNLGSWNYNLKNYYKELQKSNEVVNPNNKGE